MYTLSLKLNLWERVAHCDPASGKPGRQLGSGTARSALVSLGRDRLNRIFVLETWADRAHPDALARQIFAFQERWGHQRFGIEAAGQQNLFIGMVESQAQREGIALPLVRVQPSTHVHKVDRIMAAVAPVLHEGRLFIPRYGCEALVAELQAFPSGDTVDLVDALAGALSLFSPIPAELSAVTGGLPNPDREYMEWLAEQGMPEAEIAKRMRS